MEDKQQAESQVKKPVKVSKVVMEDCNICYEPVKANLKYGFVKCYRCGYKACSNCYEIYMTNLANDESCYPRCMKCKYTWEYNYMLKILSPTYFRKLTKLREEILYNLNLSLLPTYSNKYLDTYKVSSILSPKTRRMPKEQLTTLLLNYFKSLPNGQGIYTNIIIFLTYGGDPSFVYKEDKIKDMFADSLKKYVRNARYVLKNLTSNKNIDAKKEEPVVNRPCKASNCIGFLSSEWICYTCNTKFCRRCQEPRAKEHECDESLVENLKAIKKDSIECPKCSAFIFKIHGCDHMWCTNCHTAFNWKTRKILDTKNFHNPHYIDYIRSKEKEQPRVNNNNADPPQGDGFCNDDLIPLTGVTNNISHDLRMSLNDLYARFRAYDDALTNDIREKPIKYGLRYLNKEISLVQYKKALQVLDKKIKKMEEIRDLNDVIRLQTIEIFNTMIKTNDPLVVTKKIVETMVENNKHRSDLSLQYKNNVEIISIFRGNDLFLRFDYESYNPKKNSKCPSCDYKLHDKAEALLKLSKLDPSSYARYFDRLCPNYDWVFDLVNEKFLCKHCLNPHSKPSKCEKEKSSPPPKKEKMNNNNRNYNQQTQVNRDLFNTLGILEQQRDRPQQRVIRSQSIEEVWEEDWESD